MNCVFEYSTSVKRGLNYSLEEPCLTSRSRVWGFCYPYQSPRSRVCGFTLSPSFPHVLTAIFVSLKSVDSSMPDVNTVDRRYDDIGCKILINLPKSRNKCDIPCDSKRPRNSGN